MQVFYKDCDILFFLAAPCSMRDLSSPTRIEPSPPAVEARSPNHWTAREVLWHIFIFAYLTAFNTRWSSRLTWSLPPPPPILFFYCLPMICFDLQHVSRLDFIFYIFTCLSVYAQSPPLGYVRAEILFCSGVGRSSHTYCLMSVCTPQILKKGVFNECVFGWTNKQAGI